MSFLDIFYTRFEDVYTNPDMVIIAFTILVFVLTFSALERFKMSHRTVFPKKVNVVVAFVISIFFIIYFKELSAWIATFNIILVIVVLVLIFFLFKPFIWRRRRY